VCFSFFCIVSLLFLLAADKAKADKALADKRKKAVPLKSRAKVFSLTLFGCLVGDTSSDSDLSNIMKPPDEEGGKDANPHKRFERSEYFLYGQRFYFTILVSFLSLILYGLLCVVIMRQILRYVSPPFRFALFCSGCMILYFLALYSIFLHSLFSTTALCLPHSTNLKTHFYFYFYLYFYFYFYFYFFVKVTFLVQVRVQYCQGIVSRIVLL
jgi:hypothetical protein